MVSERFPDVTIAADPQPSDVPFRLAVEVRNGFTPEAPARVLVSIENCAEGAEQVGGGDIFPLSDIWFEDSPLVLLPTDAVIQQFTFGTDERIVPTRPIDGCWQTNPVFIMRWDVLRFRTLAAGETVTTEYAVLHYPEREILEARGEVWYGPESEPECLPAGEHRFEEVLHRRTGELSWDEFEWGFTLTLEEA
jgi:hypothetical protein